MLFMKLKMVKIKIILIYLMEKFLESKGLKVKLNQK